MSAILLQSIDRATLPPLLVPALKSHCRVEFSRDDSYLQGVASRAVDLFERLTGATVFERVYDWTVTMDEGSLYGTAWRWPGPVVPFTGFTAVDGASDVSAEYKIISATGDLVTQSWLQRGAGQPEAVPTLTALSGYKAADEIPPGILDFILRAGAWLYEFREAALMPAVDMMAYGNSLLAGQWIPRA